MNQTNNHQLSERLSDFYRFLSGEGGVNTHSRTNYISWLKFLDGQGYELESLQSYDDIDDLLEKEKELQPNRSKYNKTKDLVNFKSALRKFLQFRNSDFAKQQEETILEKIKKVENDTTLSVTERESIVKSRIGQGEFRDNLIKYWKGCSISSFSHFDLLIASHIKPWKDADNEERIDLYNGLLLLPNYDKLFDRGYISFDKNGVVMYSRYLDVEDRKLLGMDNHVHLLKLEDKHKVFLEYHRENCLML